MYKKYYQTFLNEHKNQVHLAAHSHHFWPDSSFIGHKESWELASKKSDDKWGYIFETLIPNVQQIISSKLKFSRPSDISFASNTHELLVKVLSCFFEQDSIRILTTKNEFHSFSRQIKRLKEWEKVEVDFLDSEAQDFTKKLEEKLDNKYDIIFISHVFYNSSIVLENQTIEKIIASKGDALFILDGYHSFSAIEFDLSKYENDLFFMAGGYKYAQAGAGMCFMTLPSKIKLRPLITGWFADFSALSGPQNDKVGYAEDGMRFWGSTMDFTAFFRYRSVWDQFFQEGHSVEEFDKYIKSLQKMFINNNAFEEYFVETDIQKMGHFLTLSLNSETQTESLYLKLKENGILTDFRGNRLRFGLAPYLDQESIQYAKNILKSLKR